ncbi:MAG: MerR family transcriptional regulator [Nocardiaceae bacterium]|nr:MerR family transcriptional regulator [Nocardiaceae bacterium]
MFTIGDFARHGRVSVRMLRHYDELGLLQPARVDPHSSYRYYEAAQLSRLNRIVALKELGFNLAEVGSILDEHIDADKFRAMLEQRRSELRAQIAADTARLRQVDVRLRAIDSEEVMPTTTEIVVKSLPALRVAELIGHAQGYNPDAISPVIQPLFGQLADRMSAANVEFIGPAVAYYEDSMDGGVLVHAAMPVNLEPGEHGFDIVDLPAVPRAATLIHRGSMDTVLGSWQTLARWIADHEDEQAGYAREVTLHWSENPDEWVTELQIPI